MQYKTVTIDGLTLEGFDSERNEAHWYRVHQTFDPDTIIEERFVESWEYLK